jgi:hypothetical protein
MGKKNNSTSLIKLFLKLGPHSDMPSKIVHSLKKKKEPTKINKMRVAGYLMSLL